MTGICEHGENEADCRLCRDQQPGSKSAPASGYAIDHFLLEMEEALKLQINASHKFINLSAYASADKATAKAECLTFMISRYKQNKQAGLC